MATIILCGLLTAACGGSASNGTANRAAAGYAQGLKFSACMRSHGVPDFPDPKSGSGGGIQIQIGSGVNPQSPAFQQAQTSCRKLLPGGGPVSGQASAQAIAHLRSISECMRAHGISGFPDPTTHPPSNPTGYSAILGINGAALAIPNSVDVRSPAFKAAALACNFGPRGQGVPKKL